MAEAIEEDGVTAVAVLSGNRNFEGRIHPSVRANFLASPPLVVAYALAGTVLDGPRERAARRGRDGKPVYLRDLWPDGAEIRGIIDEMVTPALFRERYATMLEGTPEWRAMKGKTRAPNSPGSRAARSSAARRSSTTWRRSRRRPPTSSARACSAMFGDMFTTDHISPIGVISKGTPAAEYLRRSASRRATSSTTRRGA